MKKLEEVRKRKQKQKAISPWETSRVYSSTAIDG